MPSPLLTAILAAPTTSTTVAKVKSSSGSSYLFILLALFAAVYFLFLRPRQQKARAQRQGGGKTLDVGDEVVTIGGILGVVSGVEGDAITVEVGPGTHMSFLRRAVNLRTAVAGAPQGAPVTAPVDDVDYSDEDEGDYSDDEEGDDESWDDEEVVGEEHPSGPASGPVTPGAGAPGSGTDTGPAVPRTGATRAGDAGDGRRNDPNGPGEVR